eukprot:2849517-Rhodomonas_salina.1
MILPEEQFADVKKLFAGQLAFLLARHGVEVVSVPMMEAQPQTELTDTMRDFMGNSTELKSCDVQVRPRQPRRSIQTSERSAHGPKTHLLTRWSPQVVIGASTGGTAGAVVFFVFVYFALRAWLRHKEEAETRREGVGSDADGHSVLLPLSRAPRFAFSRQPPLPTRPCRFLSLAPSVLLSHGPAATASSCVLTALAPPPTLHAALMLLLLNLKPPLARKLEPC